MKKNFPGRNRRRQTDTAEEIETEAVDCALGQGPKEP
jgi:hypothetical protein